MTTLTPKQNQPRRESTFSPVKVGLKKIAESVKKQAFQRVFDRKMLLKIPQDILDSHPDKHFLWVSMPKLERGGMYHPGGYKLLEAKDNGNEEKLLNHFSKAPDGYIHRNEMVLAWLPKEEFEQRKLEEDIVRGSRNPEDIIKQNPALLNGFEPHARLTVEEKEFEKPTEEATNG